MAEMLQHSCGSGFDGYPDCFNFSNLYFGNSKGNVWQKPHNFSGKTVKPSEITSRYE